MLAKAGVIAQTHISPPPPLNTYTGAQVAYSLRRLESNASNCIRVRRSSDDAEQDIGFTNNELDVSSLTSFVGANNGFVTVWYDQSGNGLDATQITTGSQPQIVSSGTVLTLNGRYTLYFDGSDDYMTCDSSSNYQAVGGEWSCFAVCKLDNNSGQKLIWNGDIPTLSKRLGQFLRDGGGGTVNSIAFDVSENAFTDSGSNIGTNQHLLFSIRTSTSVEVYANNSSGGGTATSGTPATETSLQPVIGAFDTGTSLYFIGNMQEIIHYATTDDHRIGLSNNINAYYVIY